MNIERVGIPLMPPQDPVLIPSIPEKIDFARFIEPFKQLLETVGISLVIASLYVVNSTLRIFSAAQVVFSRMIFKPDFDPYESTFKEMIDSYQIQASNLEERVANLEQRFWQDHLISHDLQELKQLNFEITETFHQLQGYVRAMNRSHKPFPVKEELILARDTYEELKNQLDDYCVREACSIVDQFENIVNFFMKGGADLPIELRQELIQNWIALDGVIRPRLHHIPVRSQASELFRQLKGMKDQIRMLENAAPSQHRQIGLLEPLKLRNIGNSCYMDSVLQALLCVDKICEQFSQPILRANLKPDEFQKKLKIQQELLQFINSKQTNQSGRSFSQMEFILFLKEDGPSLLRLREAIFKSGLHHEFQMNQLRDQLDAASMMELFVDEFLPNAKFKWQEHAETKDFPGLDFVGPIADMTMLHIPLRNLAKNQTVMRMIQFVVHRHPEVEDDPTYQRTFDPQDSVELQVLDPALAAPVLKAPGKKVRTFNQRFRFKELPDVLTLHIKRFSNKQVGANKTWVRQKDESPVRLPQDGIVDLTGYYDAPPGAQKQARYKIKSFVVHSGSLNGGHYVSYVEINGKYYYCNDLDSRGYKEITQKDFLSHKDAYLVVLERLPDEVPPEVTQP